MHYRHDLREGHSHQERGDTKTPAPQQRDGRMKLKTDQAIVPSGCAGRNRHTMNNLTARRQRGDAHRILASPSTAATGLLHWAVGVHLAWHSTDLVRAWNGGSLAHCEQWGSAGDGVYLDGDRRTATLRHRPGGTIAADIALAHVARLARRDQLPAALVAAVEASARAWHDSPRIWPHIWDDQTIALNRRLGDIQAAHGRDCEVAAAAVWAHVRPRVQPVQLDLFGAAA